MRNDISLLKVERAKLNVKKKAILGRIKFLEDAIVKGHEYLETGNHANWHGFSPLFADKVRDGGSLPPHKNWVKNVLLPRHEKALGEAERNLEKLCKKIEGKSNESGNVARTRSIP